MRDARSMSEAALVQERHDPFALLGPHREGNMGSVAAAANPSHGLPASLALTLPAAIALQIER
jgi:hypothetical protein